MNEKKYKGYIVTHTHWDREWRYPLWENRMYLVGLIDELLSILDKDVEYKAFLFDGQTVSIEDYLEVRPENTDKMKRYIHEGRILVGPWYTLPDLYPIDGECLVRNLLKGIRSAEKLGRCMKIGYESFGWGQTAQFPQIYQGFDIDTVIVAKNVDKSRAPRSEFIWEGADGTRIMATRLGQHARANFFMNAYIHIMNGMEYLSDDYKYNWEGGGLVYHQADESGYIQDYIKLTNTEKIHEDAIIPAIEKAWTATAESVLEYDRVLMNGSDSTTAQPYLTELIRKANAAFTDKGFVHTSLEDYVNVMKDKIDPEQLQVVKGELRDGPTTSLSGNALMTRPYIKILNKKVQNVLLKSAEPFGVVSKMLGGRYDTGFLDIGLKYLLLSHPHDSINGVTQDKTVDDVMYMLNQSLEIGNVIYNTACGEILRYIDTSGFDQKDVLIVTFNPLPFERNEVLKAFIDLPREWNIWSFDMVDSEGNQVDVQRVSIQEVTIPVSDLHSRPWPFYADRHVVYFDTGIIPAGGYKIFKLIPTKSYNRSMMFWGETRKTNGLELSKTTNTIENEYLRIKVNPNGTLTIFDKTNHKQYENLNYFEDTGDCGDYWMYYPPYNNKTFTSLGASAKIWVEDNGTLSATIAAEISMKLPAFAHRPENDVRGQSRRSDEEKELKVVVRYTLKRGSRKVDVKLGIHNTVEDHRFRVMFDTGIKTDYADAAGHFTVDRRFLLPLKDDSGKYYNELTTQPQQSFIDLSDEQYGFAVVNNCLIEYEAIPNKECTLALTLFRSVRNIICTEARSGGVFPDQKGGQCLGTQEYEYSIYPHAGNWQAAGVFEDAEKLNIPVKIVQTSKHEGGSLPCEYSFYSLKPVTLRLSSLKKAEDRDSFIVRLYNPTKDVVKGSFNVHAPIREAYITNLNEERQEQAVLENEYTVAVTAGPNKIVTLELVI